MRTISHGSASTGIPSECSFIVQPKAIACCQHIEFKPYPLFIINMRPPAIVYNVIWRADVKTLIVKPTYITLLGDICILNQSVD